MKFFKSDKDHISEQTFSNIHRRPSKFKYTFRGFCHLLRQLAPINWSSIEIKIKINLEKHLNLNSLDIFLKKLFFSDLTNFMGFKNYMTKNRW